MTEIDRQTSDSLREWYARTCTATAYVPAPPTSDDAAEIHESHLEQVRDRVADVADDATATRMVEALGSHHDGGHEAGAHGLVAVVDADGGEVWPIAEEVSLVVHPGPLPALGQLVSARQTWIPHAVVLLDRVGADLDIVTAAGRHDHSTVDGGTSHITKSNPGGWSQKRYQQRAEEHWHDNAKMVAEQLTREVEKSGIDLVLITGNDEMISILTKALPQRISEMLVDLGTGGRSEDGSRERVEEAVDQAVRQEALNRRVAAGQAVADAIGRGDGASGRTDVLEALFEGRVDDLLIETSAAAGLVAHVGADPAQVAADSGKLHDLGLTATRVPLTDAAIRGGLATGANLTVVAKTMHDLEDGLGASLRG